MVLEKLNWLAEPVPANGRAVQVKLRSMAPLAEGRMFAGDVPRIELAAPQYGVAPGQAAVAYDGTRVLGGGFIASTE